MRFCNEHKLFSLHFVSIPLLTPVVKWTDYRQDFGLMIGFVEHFLNVTTNNYSLSYTLHSHCKLSRHKIFSVFPRRCSVAASNGRCSPSSGFPNCPLPQLPSSHSNGSQQLSLISPLTHQSTVYTSTPGLAAMSHQHPTLLIYYSSQIVQLTSRHALQWKHRFSLL
jgi:hypothetical protein